MKSKQKHSLLVVFSILVLTGCNCDTGSTDDSDAGPQLESQVFTLNDATLINESFGTVRLFTEGNVSTYGDKQVTSGVLTILPGQEAHPPHKHAEEEYLIVTKGSGTWSINGKEFPAQTGDLLYASPWDLHGIHNSDTVDLEFFFVKWNNKGVKTPEENSTN